MTAVIALLAAAAAGLAAWAILGVVTRRRHRGIEVALAPYSIGRLTEADARPVASGSSDLAQMPLFKRLVAATAELGTRRGLLQIIEARLDQADLPMRPAEVLFFYLSAIVVGGLLVGLLVNALWGLIVAAAVGVIPWVALKHAASRRTKAFTEQLPDMLQLLGTSLRSGFSILQGLESVSQQVPDPIGKEMRHVVAEARLGRPLVSALQEVADRVKSEDFAWVVSAIAIQREIGGNLAELLDIVGDTMLARARLRREARTLTAEGRLGAVIISVLPVAIGLFVYAVNPGYIEPLFHSTSGEIMFWGSVALAGVGILWLRKIVQFEV